MNNRNKVSKPEELSKQTPIFPEVGVIGLVPDQWTGTWQPRHQVLSRLSGYFHVVWVNPALGWRDLWLGDGKGDRTNDGPVRPGFSVYQHGRFLPRLYKPKFLATLTERMRFLQARNILKRKGCEKIVLYLWRPHFGPALDLIDHNLSCYHIDDEYTFSDVEKPIDESEAKLISRVDQVFIHSPGLKKKKGHLNPYTLFVPNGVDYLAYATPCAEPADLKQIPHPRIGYTGVLKKQLNWELLQYLTRTHPEWSFIFVGPVASHPEIVGIIEKLSNQANVHFLGAKSVQDLAAYPQHFDVCLMPYEKNDYTNYIYPLKLHEYLASGRPVVGTEILSLHDFRDLIALVDTPEEWSNAIQEALNPMAVLREKVEARLSVARKHDWESLVENIARALSERLGPDYLERFEKAKPASALNPI